MPTVALDANSAAILAAVLAVVSVGIRRTRRRWASIAAAATFEAAIVLALFALWQVANSLTHTHTAGAFAHGRAIWNAERWLHLPSETSMQRLLLGHHALVQVANIYYAAAHVPGMVIFLAWLWARHRDHYLHWRNVMVLFTAMALLIETIPVAPPRLIGHTGLVDTAMAYGQSVYGFVGSSFADQYAALPSIHVGWAVLIAVAVVRCGRGWARWVVAIGHGLGTFLVVVVTANHYWLDGVSAIAVLALAYVAERGLRPVVARVRSVLIRPTSQIQQGALS